MPAPIPDPDKRKNRELLGLDGDKLSPRISYSRVTVSLAKVSTLLVLLSGVGVLMSILASSGLTSYWIAIITPWILRFAVVTVCFIAIAVIMESLRA
jgi:hypothetical protein